MADGEPEPEPEPEIHKVNDWISDQHVGRSPEQLVAEYHASYDRLIEALETVPADLQTTVVPRETPR